MTPEFKQRLTLLQQEQHQLITKPNQISGTGNGVFDRYINPVLTAAHTPIYWRYDLDAATNPYLMERFGINAAFNAGAIKFNGRYMMVVRVEGVDRKSFFAVAESPDGVSNFTFWEYPVNLPQTHEPDTNVYDMRLTQHQDGWIYGLFCTERRDPAAPAHDQSTAVAACGIARTKDLVQWERLPDLKTNSPQQRNVVLHPEFVDGKYALYTRPQDGFISAGTGGGIGFGLTDNMENAVIDQETIIDNKNYHTVYEAKNGQGPTPVKTDKGWLHLAHGVRNTAAGLRYVLYMFMTDLNNLTRVTHKPGGYFLAPEGEERVGDVSNVVFCNGWIADEDGTVYIYYASSDTRMHVATTTVAKLVDYVMNTPEDGFKSSTSVDKVYGIVDKNKNIIQEIL
ncbi:glycosidase [Mucilaginibacter sp.]|uniref:glycoside hydrolase family 130 protein n=1 Tax=Mucilaginibacter sp. TaxID=1882438 RepID=UPI0025D100CB|nr:glycosidase [Mucilaginibacter sp.]